MGGVDGKEMLAESGAKNMTTNLIGGPLPFEFELKLRSEERREQVLHMWVEEEAEAEGKPSTY